MSLTSGQSINEYYEEAEITLESIAEDLEGEPYLEIYADTIYLEVFSTSSEDLLNPEEKTLNHLKNLLIYDPDERRFVESTLEEKQQYHQDKGTSMS